MITPFSNFYYILFMCVCAHTYTHGGGLCEHHDTCVEIRGQPAGVSSTGWVFRLVSRGFAH